MARSWTALKVTPGITYTDHLGNPYRADETGLVHGLTTELAFLTAQAAPPGGAAPVLATAANFAGTKHQGAPLVWNTES